MNAGLSSATEKSMLAKFGVPGQLTRDCSAPSGAFETRVKHSVDVGPFKVSGLDYAVESLRQLFAQIKLAHPAV